MDCGVPFCHTGKLISGMASGCPINNLIPEWNDLVYRGLWREALERLHKTNNFPGVHRPRLPGAVRRLVRARHQRAAGHDQEHRERDHRPRLGGRLGRCPSRRSMRTGKKVAVIGSGPAGLAAAAQLNRAGHTVTVFERADRPGGLLMYGIPNMKLDKREVVERRLKLMEQEGIKFVCNANVGENVEAQLLRKDFDAIVICTGATQPRDLPVEGRKLDGRALRDGLPDREHARRCSTAARITARFTRATRTSIVIGGGDTGTDCVGTAMRHGCKSLVQLEILPKPPMDRADDNPWPEWPKVYKLDYGQEEAAAKFGADPRVYLTTVKKFDGDANGAVKELVTVQIEWQKNDKGQFVPVEVPGTEKTRPAQLVLLAMGFLGPSRRCSKDLGVETRSRAATSKPSTASTPRASRASSPPAIAAAARAWSCGPSTKAAARRASAIAT